MESPKASGESANALLLKAKRIAAKVARPAAAQVDREASFPQAAIAALREEKFLSAAIPVEFGGLGCSLGELTDICTALGRGCASTAMIFAMHQMQVACMARHLGKGAFFRDYLRDAAKHQWLIASGTSEVGVGGDLRSSIAPLELSESEFKLRKCCTTLSYGAYADAILITARRGPTAASGDQAIALIRKQDYTLERTGEWDPMGMRGTCSPPFNVTATAAIGQILEEPFREVAIQTMIPYSHLLWASVWLGIAADAIATSQSLIKQTARKTPKVMPLGAAKLVDAVNYFQQMKAQVRAAVHEYDQLAAGASPVEEFSTSSYALRINSVKLAASRLVGQICLECLAVCGLAGYANNSPFSLGRQLRDSLSAPLMISNNRIHNTNAGLLLVAGDEFLEDF